MIFDFESQEFKANEGFYWEEMRRRNKMIEEEFKTREKLEQTALPLSAILNQLKIWSTPKKGSIFWITVSPPPSFDIDKFINRTHVLFSVKRGYFKNEHYTFEQRGKQLEDAGTGVHVHILTEKLPKKSPKNIINNLASFYSIPHSSIDVRTYPMVYYEDKIRYLKGYKEDPEKDIKIKYDKVFREKYGLKDFY